MEHIIIEEVPLPSTVSGFVVQCYRDADYYRIFINSKLTKANQWEALLQELNHICGGEFLDDVPPSFFIERIHEDA